jgi:hypothetical protein
VSLTPVVDPSQQAPEVRDFEREMEVLGSKPERQKHRVVAKVGGAGKLSGWFLTKVGDQGALPHGLELANFETEYQNDVKQMHERQRQQFRVSAIVRRSATW